MARILFLLLIATLIGCDLSASQPIQGEMTVVIQAPTPDDLVVSVEQVELPPEHTAVVLAYEAVFDTEVGVAARKQLKSMRIHYVNLEGLRLFFPGAKEGVAGKCVDGEIWIRTDMPREWWSALLIHELLHALGRIMGTGADNCHTDPRMFSCAESVEILAQEIMGIDAADLYTTAYMCGVSSC